LFFLAFLAHPSSGYRKDALAADHSVFSLLHYPPGIFPQEKK